MKRGFTLIELMVAILLGVIIMLVVAGSLRGTIQAWEAVQTRVAQNYNHRSVLDLIKRQTSSLFFRRDADEISQTVGNSRTNVRPPQRNTPNPKNQQPNGEPQEAMQVPTRSAGFVMPDNAWFFRGTVQELNFLSTVSFLSDFPGQVAVRYYVVQGEPEEDQSLSDLPMSRITYEDDMTFDEGMIPQALEGNLYLVMEEKNLFLSTIMDDPINGDLSMNENTNPFADVDAEREHRGTVGSGEGGSGDMGDTRTMRLLGPLRDFTIRYRIPAVRRAQDADSDQDWAEHWDLDTEGEYPSAIEFVLFYETPGKTDDVPTEELPGIRMVIPVYDTNNLARGGNRNGRGSF